MNDPIDQIKAAFHNDDAAAVRQALERSPDLKRLINEPLGPFDSPPVVCARSREMLDVLLAAGADINAKSRWWAGGFGLLHGAPPELAEYAIGRGAIVDVHAAARLGKLERLDELIQADPALVHARGGDGQTPLHFAGTVEVARLLLERGAAIDVRDIDHESTPAQYMIRDRQEIARLLVSRGATTDILMAAALGDLDLVRTHIAADPACVRVTVSRRHFPKQDPRSGGTIYIWTLGAEKSPHAIAREFKRDAVFSLLCQHTPPGIMLAVAAELGDHATAGQLLSAHPKLVEALSPNDLPRISGAASNNNIEAVRLMLSAGWPVDARGQHGGTPLHWAAFHGNPEMVNLLLAHHPPLDATDDDYHSTPLGWAIHGSENACHRETSDYAATVEALLSAGSPRPEKPGGSPQVRAVLARP